MKRAQLSESELRKIIKTALLEQSPAGTSSSSLDDPDSFYKNLDTSALSNQGKSVQYLINAYTQFTSEQGLTVSGGGELPTEQKSLQTIKDYIDKHGNGLYNVQTLAWNAMTLQDKQMNATAIVDAYLKIKIIEALNDENNKVNPRDIFFIDGQVYRKDVLPTDAHLVEVLDQLKSLTKVSAEIEFSSPQFFEKLSDVNFVANITNPASGYEPPDSGPFSSAKEYPGVFYISKQMADNVIEALREDAKKQIAGMKALLDQFDTDFVENFFCTPLIYPDTWQRYCYDSGHPVSTPWRQSYIIANVASNAASIPGGVHALYHKLMQFYISGPKVQMSEGPTMSKDPYVATGMFQGAALNESRKVLVTLDELKRIISAALHENSILEAGTAAAADAGPGFWAKTGEFLTRPFRGGPDAGEVKSTTSKLIATGADAASRGVYAEIFGKLAKSAIPEIRDIAVKISRALTPAPSGARSPVIVALQNYYFESASKMPGADIETLKSDLAQILAIFAEMKASGKTVDEIIIALTKESFTGGGLESIRNMSPPKREALLQVLGRLKDSGLIVGDSAVAALKVDPAIVSQANHSLEWTRNNIIASLAGVTLDSIDAFASVGGRTIPKFRISVQIDATGTARLISQKFTTAGVPSTAPGAIKVITDTSKIADEYVNGAELLEKLNQINAMKRGNIIIEGAETPFIDVFAMGVINTMTGADDMLRGALLSPSRAFKTASLGAALKGVEMGEVSQSSLDRLTRTDLENFNPSLFKGGGKYGRSRWWSRSADTGPKKAFSALYALNRIVIGGPVRAAARGVRALVGDTGFIGRFVDTIATSGFYSTIIGMVAWWGIRQLGAASTPGSEGPISKLLNYLNMALPSGFLNFGLANFVGSMLAEAISSVIDGEEESIQGFFNTLTKDGDPTVPANTIIAAMKDNFVKVQTSHQLFPKLTISSPASTMIQLKVNAALEATAQAIGALNSVADRTTSKSAVDDVGKKADEATAKIYTILQDKDLSGARTQGNEAWFKLEQARRQALEAVAQQLAQGTTSPGASKSSVDSLAEIMREYYAPSGTAGTVNALSDVAAVLSMFAFGTEPGASDATELNRIFESMLAGRAPMLTIGANASGDDQAKIKSINDSLASLTAAYAQLKRTSYQVEQNTGAPVSSEPQSQGGSSTPVTPGAAAP